MAVTHTAPQAEAIQLQLYRAAGPAKRVQIAVDLSDTVRELALNGIRRRHPEYTEREVAEEFLGMVYGDRR